MNYEKLQSLLPNDEIHYLSDVVGDQGQEQYSANVPQHTSILKQKPEFILFEYTIDNFDTTRLTLRKNNIKHSVYTDEFDMDYILI
tara:strand:+ start:1197 stop:1454 length:258 start_codon:yes stop_codon:yes gene_type:complete